ncbi:hypothetical protein ACI3KY_03640 [Microbacterium sp. ZW T2_14]|uniref:glycosyltransferase family 39 protein n=1 Tax=Microbacterium sp. ZW T2_14 TaxID=3378079 RepID=UPI003853EF16
MLSAERPLSSLMRMLANVDAVHGLYYLFLHFWIHVFGASEMSVRLPSAIAVGFCVAGTFVVGRMLVGSRFGVLAAVLCTMLPRTDYMGAEARSYAISAAASVWITALFLLLLRHPFARQRSTRLAWLAYAVGLAIGVHLFLYLGLLLVVHGAYLLAIRGRGMRRAWFTAAGFAVILSLPMVALGYSQRGQISFLIHRGYATPRSVLVTQWFGTPVLAGAAWIVIVGAVAAAVLEWRRTGRGAPVVILGVLWVALPTLVLLAVNATTPAYSIRYLSFCVPGVALLLAAGFRAIAFRPARVAAVVLLLALAIPTDIGQRGPYAKDHGSDLAQTATIIGQQARPGDGIVFDRTTAPRQRPRLALRLYPDSFRGLEDIALKTPYRDRAELWDTTNPVSDVTAKLAPLERVWVVERTGSADNIDETDVRALESAGFTVTSAQLVHRTVIYLLTRHQ